MFIEQNESLQKMYKSIIDSMSNYQYVPAKNGVEANQKAMISEFDLFCMDFNAEKITGVELIATLRDVKFNKNKPILVIAEDVDDAKKQCTGTTFRNIHFVEKPTDKELLKALVIQLTNEVLTGPDKQQFAVNVEFVASFVDSAKDNFKTMFRVKDVAVLPKANFNINDAQVDICGEMFMVTSKHQLRIVLGMPKDTYLKVLSGMMKEEFTDYDDRYIDGIAEMLDILFCHAQRRFLTKKLFISKTPPTAHMGSDVWIEVKSGQFIPIAMTSEYGPFYFGINVKTA